MRTYQRLAGPNERRAPARSDIALPARLGIAWVGRSGVAAPARFARGGADSSLSALRALRKAFSVRRVRVPPWAASFFGVCGSEGLRVARVAFSASALARIAAVSGR